MSDTGWRRARLGNLIEAKYGKALTKDNRAGGEVPVYGANGVVGHHNVAITQGPTIIIGRKGSVGEVNLSPVPCWPIDTTYYIDEPGPYSIAFLDRLLRALGLTELDRSTAIPGLSRDQLYDIEVPVPSEGDQEVIVDTLNAASAGVHSVSEKLARVSTLLRHGRIATLAAAVDGKLTEGWRDAHEGAEPAEMLLQEIDAARRLRLGKRYRAPNRVEAPNAIPPSWVWTTIGALVDVATGATPLRSRSDYYGGSIPWVTSGAVNDGLISGAKEHITDLALEETNAKIFPKGTLLLAMYGEGQTRGRAAELGIEAATNQAVAALLFDESTCALRPYIRLFLQSNYERIRQLSFGGVQPNLSMGVVRDTPIPLPPLPEQVQIYNEANRLLGIISIVETRLIQAERTVGRVTGAVARKAFLGEINPSG